MAWTDAARRASAAARRAKATGRKKPFRAATSRRSGGVKKSQRRTRAQVAKSVRTLAKRKGVQVSTRSHSTSDLRRIERHLKSRGGGKVNFGKPTKRKSSVGKRGPSKQGHQRAKRRATQRRRAITRTVKYG